MALSLDHESANARPGPQSRQPDGRMGRRPSLLLFHDGSAAARGRVGGRNEIGPKAVSLGAGLTPVALSRRPPDPAAASRPVKEGRSPDDPPRPRSPTELGPPFEEASPPPFDWPRDRERISIGTGRDSTPGTAALPRGARPPESEGVLGAVRLAQRGQGAAPVARYPSRAVDRPPSPPMLRPRRKGRQRNAQSPWPGIIFSLVSENLMRVRRDRLFLRAIVGRMHRGLQRMVV